MVSNTGVEHPTGKRSPKHIGIEMAAKRLVECQDWILLVVIAKVFSTDVNGKVLVLSERSSDLCIHGHVSIGAFCQLIFHRITARIRQSFITDHI